MPSEPTRIAEDVRGGLALTDSRLAWSGLAASGDDEEIFLADAAQPIAESIGPCPLTNPCQLTADDNDDLVPLRSQTWVVWQRTDLPAPDRSLWFFDGAQVAAIPGSIDRNAARYGNLPALSGSRLVWRGSDDAGTEGIFLADLALPLTSGATAACPATNPCRILASPASRDDSAPTIDGSRIAWSAAPAPTEDFEIFFFDATLATDTASPLACPLSNPCLLTNNDRADVGPLVSASAIAWVQCGDLDCYSEPPDRMVVQDGAERIEIISEYAAEPHAMLGSRVAWVAFLSHVQIFDAALPLTVAPNVYPAPCPAGNPCRLHATGSMSLAGHWLLSTNATDVANQPIHLRLFDLQRPFDPWPYDACPDGNPCIPREDVANEGSLSTKAIAWLECPPTETNCWYPYDGGFDLYVVPEPNGIALATAAFAAMILLARHRRAVL